MHSLSQIRINLLLGIILVVAASVNVSGQKVQFDVEHYGLEDGIPALWVTSLIIHSSDYVYVGTTGGLARFDGYGFTPVTTTGEYADELRGTINSMGQFENGDIIMSIGQPSRRGGDVNEIFIFDPSNNKLRKSTQDSLELGLSNELKGPDFAYVARYTGDSVIIEDDFGNRFIHTSEGRKPLTAKLELYNGYEVDLGEAWRTLPATTTVRSRNLSDVMYWATYNGMYKVSMRISPFDVLLKEDIESYAYGTISRAIGEIDSNTLIVSVEGQGIWLIDQSSGAYSRPLYLKSGMPAGYKHANYYRQFQELNDGSILCSPHSKLYTVSFEAEQVYERANMPGRVMASCLTDMGHLFAATVIWGTESSEVYLVDTSTWELQSFIPSNASSYFSTARPTYAESGESDKVWYATKTGLYHLDVENELILHLYTDKDSEIGEVDYPVSRVLSGPHIWAMHVADDGRIWLGLDSDGLNILDPVAGAVESYSAVDGLSNNTIASMLFDSTGVWLGTFSGLSHFDTAQLQFRNFYIENGISHNEFNRFSQFIDHTGKYYMGTMNGITSFYPGEVLRGNRELQLLLSEVSHFDKGAKSIVSYPMGNKALDEIDIPADNRLLTMRFALNDFNNPQGNEYYYRLEQNKLGTTTSERWTALEAGNQLRFENLEAGSYTLYAKGVSATGESSTALAIPIRVHEYFYRTWWFIAAMVLLGFAVITAIYRMRIAQALKIERLRTRLSSDLHDDVGGLLSGVAFQMEVLEYTVPEENKPLVQRVAKSSRTAMEKMRDVVWAIDSRRETLQDLRERMLEFADEVLAPLEKGYTINTNGISMDMKLSPEVRHNMLLIYKEFVNNSVKHAQCERINASFNQTGRELRFTVKDDGVGFDVDSANGTGQGLENMRMRAARMNGKIEFVNRSGFAAKIRVPI